ncbi:MAG TPA: efflux RND transporter permease subunit [Chitinivibrionales bacterium]|nr:efflux RND transporter permease subunit [Chitinivibrionales bacterium]
MAEEQTQKRINPLVEFSVSKRVTITMLILIVMVFGFLAFTRLPLDMFPDISYPVITVATSYTGVAPEEVERLVTVPLEGVIAGVNGVKKVSSTSSEGYSSISVEFEWGTNLDAASQDIKDFISRIKDFLPDGVSEPMVLKFNMSQIPIMFSGVAGIDNPYKLKKYLEDNVQQRIQRLDGVAQVLVYGGNDREIQIALDPTRLKGKGIGVDGVVNALRMQNMNTPAGYMVNGGTDYLVRAMGEFANVDDIKNAIIGAAADGTPVRLYEVAEVNDTYKEKRSLSRMNGMPTVFLIISKQSGANTLKVSQRVNKEIEAIKKAHPMLVFHTILDQGDPVKRVTGRTIREGIIGALLAVLLLFIFLGNIRPTLIIAVAIPLSIITTFIALYAGGFTLNLMTLGGFALGIGRLVDDAVVVIENIYRHLMRGEPPVTAARRGASEVSMAIAASTFTTIIVFLPLLFSTGLAGQLTRGLCLTIMFALLASLFVAFTIVPMLSSVFFRKPKTDRAAWFENVKTGYGSWLSWVLDHPWITAGIVAAVLVVSLGAGAKFLGKEFMPDSDNGMMVLNVEMPQGTPLEETASLTAQLQKLLQSYPEVGFVGEMVGADDENSSHGEGVTGPNGAQVFVRLLNPDQRDKTQQQIQDDFRKRLPELKNAKITLMAMSGFTMGSTKPLTIHVYGNNLATLRDISQNVLNVVKAIPGVKDVESSFSKARPEYHFVIDRQKALMYGLMPLQVQTALQAANLGSVATQLRTGDEEIDVRVILDKRFRDKLDYLQQLPLKTPAGVTIPLSQVATVLPAEGPVVIKRDNKFRVGIVDGNITDRPLGAIVADVKTQLAPIEKSLPAGYSISYKGDYENMQESFQQLALALVLAILLIYMVMASQFESLVHPFTIMFTIPLAGIGVVWILLLLGKTLSMVSFLGVIILTGIVVSNGIVMVDYINQCRHAGMAIRDAILEGCKTRLRPVIITAGATIIAMIPMGFFGGTEGAATSPMALSVIGGLISATFLTLFVVPLVYNVLDQIGAWVKRGVKRVIG